MTRSGQITPNLYSTPCTKPNAEKQHKTIVAKVAHTECVTDIDLENEVNIFEPI